MSQEGEEGLNVKCRADGCERQAVVWWKRIPLCVPHYQERIEQPVHVEPVRTPASEIEPGLNRHP
jgi:hypothetical protein